MKFKLLKPYFSPEDCCYITCDWESDISKARARGKDNSIARDYVLPGSNLFYVRLCGLVLLFSYLLKHFVNN